MSFIMYYIISPIMGVYYAIKEGISYSKQLSKLNRDMTLYFELISESDERDVPMINDDNEDTAIKLRLVSERIALFEKIIDVLEQIGKAHYNVINSKGNILIPNKYIVEAREKFDCVQGWIKQFKQILSDHYESRNQLFELMLLEAG